MTIGTALAYVVPLAHQGGWDEILVVLAPLLVLAGLLMLATRRVNARLGDQPPNQGDDGTEAAQDVTAVDDRVTAPETPTEDSDQP